MRELIHTVHVGAKLWIKGKYCVMLIHTRTHAHTPLSMTLEVNGHFFLSLYLHFISGLITIDEV